MPIEETSWKPEAEKLGFETETDMLKSLYLDQALSINQMSKLIGYSSPVIRQRLLNAGVTLRQRGGSNNSTRRLAHLTDIELTKSIPDLVALYHIHPATISNERRLRRKLKQQEMKVETEVQTAPTLDSEQPQ